MEIFLDDYHKKVNAEKLATVAYWKAHPQSHSECLKRLKLLREQRLASQSYINDARLATKQDIHDEFTECLQ